jgi:HK97 family phage portal protein
MARSGKKSEVRNVENPTIPVSSENFLAFFGLNSAKLPHVSIDSALCVPAVTAAVAFLSRTMAALPLHAYRDTKDGPKKISGKLESVIHDAPNDEMDSFKFRQYFWQQVFTGGRGLAWIERAPQGVEAIWPMDPYKTTIRRVDMKLVYSFEGKDYPSADIIDLPFMLRPCGVRHYGPIVLASRAIQLALSMNDYASNFFAGGGVPPLSACWPAAGWSRCDQAGAGRYQALDRRCKEQQRRRIPDPGWL